MEIKRMMNSEYLKIIVSQNEFEELLQGLDTSVDRSTFLFGDGMAQQMINEMEEFSTL